MRESGDSLEGTITGIEMLPPQYHEGNDFLQQIAQQLYIEGI